MPGIPPKYRSLVDLEAFALNLGSSSLQENANELRSLAKTGLGQSPKQKLVLDIKNAWAETYGPAVTSWPPALQDALASVEAGLGLASFDSNLTAALQNLRIEYETTPAFEAGILVVAQFIGQTSPMNRATTKLSEQALQLQIDSQSSFIPEGAAQAGLSFVRSPFALMAPMWIAGGGGRLATAGLLRIGEALGLAGEAGTALAFAGSVMAEGAAFVGSNNAIQRVAEGFSPPSESWNAKAFRYEESFLTETTASAAFFAGLRGFGAIGRFAATFMPATQTGAAFAKAIGHAAAIGGLASTEEIQERMGNTVVAQFIGQNDGPINRATTFYEKLVRATFLHGVVQATNGIINLNGAESRSNEIALKARALAQMLTNAFMTEEPVLETGIGTGIRTNMVPPETRTQNVLSTGGETKAPDIMDKIGTLKAKVVGLLTSLSVLEGHGIDIQYPKEILLKLLGELNTQKNIATLTEQPLSPKYSVQAETETGLPDMEDAIALFTRYSLQGKTAGDFISMVLQDIVTGVLTKARDFSPEQFAKDPRFVLIARHAANVARNWIDHVMAEYLSIFPDIEGMVPRLANIIPTATKHPLLTSELQDNAIVGMLTGTHEGFGTCKVWSFDHNKKTLVRAMPRKVRAADKFYGYDTYVRLIDGQFKAFAAGERTTPLGFQGPPGVGKSELITAFATKYNIDLVILQADALLNLKEVMEYFKNRSGKYLLLIDDIRSHHNDEAHWKQFHEIFLGAEGASYPNIMVAFSTNSELMPSVLSRTVAIVIPDISEPVEAKLDPTGEEKQVMNPRVLSVAKGIIREHLNKTYAKIPDELKKMAEMVNFIIQDFYMGEAPPEPELTPYWDNSTFHDFERSPRGLWAYLEKGLDEKRIRSIKLRYFAFQQKLPVNVMLDKARADAAEARGEAPPPQERLQKEPGGVFDVGDLLGGGGDDLGTEAAKFGINVRAPDTSRKAPEKISSRPVAPRPIPPKKPAAGNDGVEELIDVPIGEEEPTKPGEE